MSFEFSASQVEFGYKGKEYTLAVNARLAVDLEKSIGMHPLTLAQRINKAISNEEMPPVGQMAEFFQFMLKRAGAVGVSFEEVYGEMMRGEDAQSVGAAVGELLGVFIPKGESDPKQKQKQKATKK